MAMTVSRLGADNEGGDKLALFLKQFGGEVLTTFDEKNVALNAFSMRNITSGKSAQFPAIGTVSAALHTPGNQITGQSVKHSERVITIDGLLVADTFIANIDEAMNHYEVRSEYSHKSGEALAIQADKHILQMAVLAARSATTITGGSGGSSINSANCDTNAADLASTIFTAAQTLDEKDVPDSERMGFFKPAQYYLLVQGKDAINRDWGGAGAYSDGTVYRIAGIPITKTNHVPVTNITDPIATKYDVNASTTVGIVAHKEAVGTVKLLNLAVETDYLIDYQGWLTIAKYAMGHGIRRPESAIEIRKSTPV